MQKIVSGQGISRAKENGKFVVKGDVEKSFTTLSDAIAYYDALENDKAIWDVTTIPELLEYTTYKKNNL